MNKIDSTSPVDAADLALLEAFRGRYPFTLDPFQEEAIRDVAAGSSVIVSAPTGAGKTLIAEFAIFRALDQGKRIAYTTPIKALSNQKYADFCRLFGEAQVGILTGDVRVRAEAPVLVMTTEILRNMLYLEPPENLGYVVLDECHYMGDEGRGTVWEEVIINCPQEVQLIALSATVSNIREIAAWIGEVHRPIKAIHHPTRPVPLQYLLVDPAGSIVRLEELRQKGRQSLALDRPRRRSRRRWGPDSNGLIRQLQARRWLPGIYFIFSRAGCEIALRHFLTDGLQLIHAHRQHEVEEAIERTLLDYPSIDAEGELNSLIIEGLRRGVGVHHAGILPALKRLIEGLFEAGLVQVVFATETMSLGIHMPAKSVVIQSLRKRAEHGFRTLLVGELTQMAGRAGRRGIDREGNCIVAVDNRELLPEALRLIGGRPEPIVSQFRISYSAAALLLQCHPDRRAIRRTIERSFGQFQLRQQIKALEKKSPGVSEGRRAKRPGDTSPLQPALQRRLRALQRLQHTSWEQFLAVSRVLEHFGYLQDGILSAEGRLIASLRHDNELLLARVVFSGILQRLRPPELAALLSCLSEEPREVEPLYAKLFLTQHPHLRKRINAMERLAQELLRVQRSLRVDLPVSLHVGYLAAAHRWASGEADWTRLVQDSYGGHEGDLIRVFRRLIDLCRQLADNPEVDSRTQALLWESVSSLDRDIVLESALI